jgi:hypothetical protein
MSRTSSCSIDVGRWPLEPGLAMSGIPSMENLPLAHPYNELKVVSVKQKDESILSRHLLRMLPQPLQILTITTAGTPVLRFRDLETTMAYRMDGANAGNKKPYVISLEQYHNLALPHLGLVGAVTIWHTDNLRSSEMAALGDLLSVRHRTNDYTFDCVQHTLGTW